MEIPEMTMILLEHLHVVPGVVYNGLHDFPWGCHNRYLRGILLMLSCAGMREGCHIFMKNN
ncbi:MAG: hypothetical protein DRN21_01595 [Thermoplasmata archaeon]|nr:MAG: hypothetical protein DRN21_01595 [Thermoplasmata archaeon]